MLRLLTTGLLLNLLLVAPAWWRDGAFGSVWLAPEAWLLAALFAVLPVKPWTRWAAWVVAAILALVIIAGFFDGLLRQVLSRPLNVMLDPLLLQAGFHLIDGSLGRIPALLASLLLAVLCALLVIGIHHRLKPSGLRGRGVLAVVVLGSILTVASYSNHWPWSQVEPVAAELAVKQSEQVRQTLQSYQALQQALASNTMQARAIESLAGRDVYLVFIESYGVSVIDQDRYSRHLLPLLEQAEARLREAGLEMRSTRLEAPIRGGQSWLAHASVLTGLRIDNQYAYRQFLGSGQETLANDFRATGHQSLKITPAIIMDWPEGEQLGFDRIYAAADLDYQGPPLGWVTMPDQYTLHHFSESIRPRYSGPVFAQIALISSHAPWTPVIEPIADWSEIGDGQVFGRWQDTGPHPLRLWTRPQQIQKAYRRSIEYSLEVTLDWARQYLPEDGLLIVLGDHQAASPVTGRGVSADVPVHVISGDRELLVGFEPSGFERGLIPQPAEQVAGLEALREMLGEL